MGLTILDVRAGINGLSLMRAVRGLVIVLPGFAWAIGCDLADRTPALLEPELPQLHI